MSLNRKIARTAAAGAAIGTAIALALPGVASAADPYPTPTVSAKADGNNVITTLTDNGTGKNSAGVDVTCLNAGMPADKALALANADPAELDFGELLPQLAWFDLATTTGATNPEVEVTSPEVPDGVYASLGVCLSNFLATGMEVESFGYDIVFVPGGIGSLGQGFDLGSQILKMDNGSSILLDQGSSFLGS